MYKGIIYKITNLINGKMYVGKTTANPKKYWVRHKTLATGRYVNKYLYKSMRKYGLNNFSFEEIETYKHPDVDKFNEGLNSLEIYHIKNLNTKVPSGYNLTDGGEGTVGFTPSEETRAKLSKARMGVPSPRKGVKLTKETRKKLSEARKGRFTGEDNPFYGRVHTKETKNLIRKKNTEYQNLPQVKLQNKLKQPNRIPVIMCNKDKEPLKEFISLREAKNWITSNTKFKGDVSTISRAVEHGKLSYGFKWIQVNDKEIKCRD